MFAKKIQYLAEIAALKAMLAFCRLLGLDRSSALGGWLGRNVGPKLGITRRARGNIKRAMPELSTEEVERIVVGMWDNLGRTAFEYAHLDKFSRPEERHRVEVVGIEGLLAYAATGKGGMLVSGHFANWELMPLVMRLEGLDGGGVYRAANNPYVNDWMVTMRRELIVPEQIAKGPKGARLLIQAIRDKRFVAMLIDQRLTEGIEAKLFGLPAMTTPTPAVLALRYNAALIPASIVRTQGAHFRITVHEPVVVDKDAEPTGEILRVTQLLNDFLEARIREHPEGWFWLHNRWRD
ncbi:lauroyl acyltransferase [Parvibaculum sedimenti]|uniref:Lauroyl acyltransferase n=1 Tax=Parvibaculum sedimenti TaxID=2608632 RepID=A0A6N6VIC4_9HYPH|nr:lauroyl acyltransferase [Parvibaculum sedimenti]KAB7739822.1 lauroyl acyltransferase [Parvibaculum sedimenti]